MSTNENPDVIDAKTLERLRELESSSGIKLLSNLINLFEKDYSQDFPKLLDMFSTQNYGEVSRIAHNFKSSCANLGAFRLRDLFQNLEDSKKNPDASQIAKWLEEARTEFPKALSELKRNAF